MIGSIVLVVGVAGSFLVTIAVSVILLVRRKLATYIPVAGGFLMIGFTVAADLIA